ncbi:MAG TPA: ABC transporter permease [Vicinamibacterales bacterium]|nr:ABC transporter permease [Vicinamibacterales bacterium]
MREWLNSLRLRLHATWRRRQLDQDLRDEMAFHVAMRQAQLGQAGAANPGAEARRRFGSTARIAEELRDRWALMPRLASLARDFRYAVRGLGRHPGFALVVVLTLGIGIGINTATFSIINAVLIRPLGFPDPDRLVALQEDLAGFSFGGAPFSPPDFIDLQREQQSFEAVGAYRSVALELSGTNEPVLLDAARVTPNLFTVLGVSPHLGRTFRPEEERQGTDVAILSWSLWHARFGGDRSVLGRTIVLDRRPYTVVGIMPAAFEFPRPGPQINNRRAELWVPLAFTDAQRVIRGNEFIYSAIARLKRGTSVEAANAELAVQTRRINDRYPPGLKGAGFVIGLSAVSLHDEIAGHTERPLLLLLVAVGLVLLVACANIANLVLSRAATRAREVALRRALGSSRGRLLQLLLAETSVLSVAGGTAGVAIAMFIVASLPATVAEQLPAARSVPIDGSVLAFTAGLIVITSLAFALIPLAAAERGAPGRTLQEETARTTPGVRRHRIQATLVVLTVVLACVLLAGAGLFIRSFTALMATDAGFNADRVLTAAVTLPGPGYQSAASVHAFHDAIFRQASSLPGIRSAALATDLPLEAYERRTLAPEGFSLVTSSPRNTNLSWTRGPYFTTLGIRLRSGRFFTDAEDRGHRNVVIVNQRLADTFWPGQDAIGKRLRWGLDVTQNPNPWLTIVGIVDDVADGPLEVEPYLHAYEPFTQLPDFMLENFPGSFGRDVKLVIRTNDDPRALASPVRGEIARIDRSLAVQSISTMSEQMADAVAPKRFSALTLSAFAGGALLLAGIGLYGLLAFGVSERRREIAVRLALGAEPAKIVRLVVRQGLTLVAIGLVLGVCAAYAVATTVDSLLYRTESHDLVAFGAVPVLLAIIAVAACLLPAYRASRVESITALRAE